jgi:type III secretion protein U
MLDIGVEYFLYYKDLKMDKQEVKQEMKDSEGNPEVKNRRKEVFMEMLSGETAAAIEQSTFVVANPTHIAIGIYVNEDVTPIPFISVRETNARALAVIRYAESRGVPVVRNVSLARSIYQRCPRRYMFVDHRDLFEVLKIIDWLKDVEAANGGWSDLPEFDAKGTEAGAETDPEAGPETDPETDPETETNTDA